MKEVFIEIVKNIKRIITQALKEIGP